MTRRDPGSPAFVDLGLAYLALGRPREAVDVGARGLQANPNSTAGRLMVSEAFVQMHRWKEAQIELLKVVKYDRNNVRGFTLLGEVLMRRSDYERALPVLQHAQNLDAHNRYVQDLAYRARSRLPLDPPPPIPMPMEPVGAPAGYGGGHGGGFGGGADFDDDSMPTRVAGPLGMGMGGPSAGTPNAPTMGLNMGNAAPGYGAPPPPAPSGFGAPPAPAPAFRTPAAPPPAPSGFGGPSAPAPVFGQPAAAPEPPPKKKSKPQPQPLPPGAPLPRPRVLPAEKPRDAAQESLRQSAAAGEDYLNNLLTSGLLDVPNVRAPEAPFELAPGKRWGRSTRRAFIFLFIMLFASVGGGGYWYYRAAKQRDADVARHIADARALMESGAYADLKDAVKETQMALDRDSNSQLAMAVYAKAASLAVLLYGAEGRSADLADLAVNRTLKEIGEGDDGWNDLVIAQSALTLGLLHRLEEPKNQLADSKKRVDDWLAKDPDDPWARWLEGKVLQYSGDYEGALQAFEKAEAGGKGPVVATISAADMYLDRGDTEKAKQLYDQVLEERAPKHPLALLGRVLLVSETSADAATIAGAINVNFDAEKDYGPRIDAYKTLVLAMSKYLLEEYVPFGEQLDQALGVTEPRYLARVAYGRLLQGEVSKAVDLRAQIKWYGAENPATPPPLVTLLDAELMLIHGAPDDALARLEGIKGVRAMSLRGRAYYDRGDYDKAIDELEKVLEVAPSDLRSLMWLEAARLVAAAGSKKKQEDANVALNKLGRGYVNLMIGVVHGDALKRVGRDDDARRKLERSLEDMTPENPNPLAYRAHVALAELDFAAGKRKDAREHLEKAAEQVFSYLRADALAGRMALSEKDYDDAAAKLGAVLEETSTSAPFDIELAYAEAVASKRKAEDAERDKARAAVRRAKDKGAPVEELTRVAELVDPALLEELGLAAAAAAPPPKKGKKKGRRRR